MSQNKKHRKHKSKRKRKTKSSDEEESDDDEIDGWKLETIDGIPTFVQELPKPKENPFSPVVLNIKDKCSLIQLSDDKLTALIGQHGYSMVRATHGVEEGSYYFEIFIPPERNKGHIRVGWSREEADLRVPCGFDKFSYSYGDVKGHAFHESRGRKYGETYGNGDVIGCYIYLPHCDVPPKKPLEKKEKYTNDDGTQYQLIKKTKVEEELKGSKIAFFKNGICQGIAFENILRGKYYPAVSLYMGGCAICNFGPTFKFQPNPKDVEAESFTPISALYDPTKPPPPKVSKAKKRKLEKKPKTEPKTEPKTQERRANNKKSETVKTQQQTQQQTQQLGKTYTQNIETLFKAIEVKRENVPPPAFSSHPFSLQPTVQIQADELLQRLQQSKLIMDQLQQQQKQLSVKSEQQQEQQPKESKKMSIDFLV